MDSKKAPKREQLLEKNLGLLLELMSERMLAQRLAQRKVWT